jgi:uracil permease
MNEPAPERAFRHGLDQWPPPLTTLLLCLQWLVALLPGLLVLGDVLATAQGLEGAGRVAFMQRLLLVAAAAQAAQILWGHGLPGLVGPSAVLLVGVLATLDHGAPASFGAMAVGGLLAACAGMSGLAARLGRLYTTSVLASTLLLLVVSLAPTMRDAMFDPGLGGDSPAAAFAFGLCLILAMLWTQHRFSGALASATLLLGMALGSAAYYLLGLAPWPGWSWAAQAAWGLPTVWSAGLSLDPGVILAMCLCYLALMANELASVESLGMLVGVKDSNRRAGRGVAVSGLSGLLAGLTGVPGTVTYSLSPGLLLATGSASRWTLLPAAGMLALLALWPAGLAVVRLAPPVVVGAVLVTLMAHSVHAALQLLPRNGGRLDLSAGLVVGSSLTVGLIVTFMPPIARAAFPGLLKPLMANGFVLGLAMALVMEHLVLRHGSGRAGQGPR